MSPDYFTWEGDPLAIPVVAPRRPGIDDVGGGAKLDDQTFPPDPSTMPTAADENQQERQIVGMAKVVAAVIISISFPAGVPTKEAVVAVSGNVSASDVTLTDNGNGNTSIVVAAGKLPAATWRAKGLTQNDDVEIDRLRAVPIANGVRVVSKLGATGTDCAFTIELSGT